MRPPLDSSRKKQAVVFCERTLSLNVTMTNGSCILLLLFLRGASHLVSCCHCVIRPHLWGSLILSDQSDGLAADITVSGQGQKLRPPEVMVRCVLWVVTLPLEFAEDTQATV